MKTKAPLAICLMAFFAMLALASPAWAGNSRCTGGSDNATWSLQDNKSSISINTGSTGDLSVSMQSPYCLNTSPNFPGTLSVYTDVALDSDICPDGSSGSGATCNLEAPVATITNNPQQYIDFGQPQTYQANFDATNATAGTYTFHIHANASDPDQTHQNGNNLDGYGWGYGGGVELTVTVTNPQSTCDPNDQLNVSFPTPHSGNVNFCSGGTNIPISISASDTSNLITSLTASVNAGDVTGSLAILGLNTVSAAATGSYNASSVGAYVFNAVAKTACTQGEANVTVDVVYVISGLDGNLGSGQKPKHGHTVPIQFTPKDCSGNLVPYDSTVEVKVYDSSNTLVEDSTPAACTGSACGTGTSSHVTFTAGQYQANSVPPAVDTYTVKIYFGGVLNFSTTFTTI